MFAKVAVVLLVAGLCALPTLAQVPKVEIFGGFQYDRSIGANFMGWDAAVTGNANRWFGITGDFSGTYGIGAASGFHEYKYMGGPVFSVAKEAPVSAFVHVLFGGVHDTAGGASANGFVLAPGGGVDIKAGKRMALRIAQLDWLLERGGGAWSKKNFRYSAGIVFRF
jgi:hypothetical protein